MANRDVNLDWPVFLIYTLESSYLMPYPSPYSLIPL
jgi:hypothetical protein